MQSSSLQIVSSAEERDDPDAREAEPCRADLRRPVVESEEMILVPETLPLIEQPSQTCCRVSSNLGFGEAAPHTLAPQSPIVGSKEGGDSLGPGKSSPNSAAICIPMTPGSNPVIKDLLRDTPEPCTPNPEIPLTPRASRITVEAANEPAVNVEDVVERLLPS